MSINEPNTFHLPIKYLQILQAYWENYTILIVFLTILFLVLLLFLIRYLGKKPNEEPVTLSSVNDLDELKLISHEHWISKLKNGLSKTRSNLQSSLSQVFARKSVLDEDLLEQLHEILYKADIGTAASDRLVNKVRSSFKRSEIPPGWEEIKETLREEIANILSNATFTNQAGKPKVILIVGVNGVGKTTTIGKLAAHFLAKDKSVLLCAADTYRAAAIDQLEAWGERLGIKVIHHKPGGDPAAVAYDSVRAAISREIDVLLIDTAGRLHNRKELMDELSKINKVIGKDIPGAPHETWLVIDATTGQNAIQQVASFKEVVSLTGIIVTKLDGTAKGGVLIGLCQKFSLPISYIGVGEKPADLREFSPIDYANSLFD